jgi:hypothetical protein
LSKRLSRQPLGTGLIATSFLFSSAALAEKTIAKGDGYEIYTDGRVGGFVSEVYGQGYPTPKTQVDMNGIPRTVYEASGGGFRGFDEKQLVNDPALAAGQSYTEQGVINSMRLRSGFLGNILGFGVRSPVTETTTATAYVQLWGFIESIDRNKANENLADFRQGYGKLDGPWGSFTAGRTRALLSRGATDINFKYAHQYGVGYPGQIDNRGPTSGMIGFGALSSGWGGTLQYATPELVGFQLTVGIFDPIQLQASGLNRTKYARPEAELRYKVSLGSEGMVELFANGGVQKVYKDGYCPPKSATSSGFCDETAGGMGYGGRFEYGIVHVGVAGHFGHGLGLTRAMEVSDASTDPDGHLRDSDGYYLQTQFVIRNFDLFAGVGLARIFLTDGDKQRVPNPADPTGQTTVLRNSVIKNQIGANAGVVYHMTPSVHFDVDYMRAEANWYLGEQQVIHVLNSGMTLTW